MLSRRWCLNTIGVSMAKVKLNHDVLKVVLVATSAKGGSLTDFAKNVIAKCPELASMGVEKVKSRINSWRTSRVNKIQAILDKLIETNKEGANDAAIAKTENVLEKMALSGGHRGRAPLDGKSLIDEIDAIDANIDDDSQS